MHLLKLIMSDTKWSKIIFCVQYWRATGPSHRGQVAQYTLWPWGCAVLLNLGLLITSFLTICWTPLQSAYRRHHSTETSLLYINAIGSQKLSCLCLLDLWYHRPWHLLTRLSSWFGINGSVLDWFRSYLLSRTFCVKCNDCFASLHTSLMCSSRLCSRSSALHNVYNSNMTLSTLISSLSLYDTQLFLSFHPSDF